MVRSLRLKVHHSIQTLFVLSFSVATVLITPAAYAAENCGRKNTLFQNPIKYCNFTELLFALIDGVIIILIPVLTLGIVYIGFRMVLAGGSKPEEYTKWRTSLLYALLGLFLVLGVKGIFSVIDNTVGQLLREDESATGVYYLPGDGGAGSVSVSLRSEYDTV